MKRLALLTLPLLVLCGYLVACDSADNPIAPSGSSLTLTASPTSIALSGEAANLTVTGFRPDGNPLNPGTQLTISTNLGVINTNTSSANIMEVGQDGRATATLTGDGRQGTATVTVSLTSGGDGASTTAEIQVGVASTDKPTIAIEANPTEIALDGSSQITMTARNADGTILSSGTVSVRTSLGTLTSGSDSGSSLTIPFNSSSGTVIATLTSNQAGSATVTASVDSSDEQNVTVEIGTTLKPVVSISANPSTVDIGATSEITVFARDSNGNLLQGQNTATLTSDGGTLGTTSLTLNDGSGSTTFTAVGPAPSGEITAFVGNSDVASLEINIRDVPSNVTLNPDRTTITGNGSSETVVLTVTVVNQDGVTLPDEPVNFILNEIDGTISSSFSENPAFSNASGEATSTLTVNVPNSTGSRFTVTATGRNNTESTVEITIVRGN